MELRLPVKLYAAINVQTCSHAELDTGDAKLKLVIMICVNFVDLKITKTTTTNTLDLRKGHPWVHLLR